MSKENELSPQDANGNYYVQASILFFETHGRFPWDEPRESNDWVAPEVKVRPLHSLRELLRLLSQFVKKNGDIYYNHADDTVKKLVAPRKVDLVSLSNDDVLQEAIELAHVLFETYIRQYDPFYMENPAAWEKWLANVAHYLSRYRLYPNFPYASVSLCKRYLVMKDHPLQELYGYPFVPRRKKNNAVEHLRSSLNLINLES